MRHIVLTSLATLIATVLLAGAAVAASPGASLNKGKAGPSAGAMRPGITQPSAPFRPSPIATNPNLPRPGAGLPTIPPGRIGPINPPVANPPVANPPGFTPPPTGGLPNPCAANPGLCRINPPVAGPPNLNPPVDGGIPNLCRINPRLCQPPGINPPGGNPPGNNPPGNNPPGNPPPVGDNNPPGGGGGGGHGHHHHHPFPYFGIGLAADLAAPTVVEYVTQPVAVAPAEAQPVAPAAPVAAVASPFDDFLARLNGLDRAMEQRLITKEEYRSQREAILASLDAGQVSRSIGMQAGLQWLKSLAEAGKLSPKEYDTKRKEFVLFL